jgi:hypothetical protein
VTTIICRRIMTGNSRRTAVVDGLPAPTPDAYARQCPSRLPGPDAAIPILSAAVARDALHKRLQGIPELRHLTVDVRHP